ncbi:hypothetical protein [Microbispora sp. GKU 823]|uniref:hypothetical protein n=1 Tax=Microbispora sp. GKU 823 TaxID=1652100 RepID=UPI00117FF9DC|nr:hypothetical protein [Microbispora sp. GKU 823]
MRATFPLLVRARAETRRRPEAAGSAATRQVRHIGGVAGVPEAGHATTNAGVLAGFAQEARS